MRIAAIRLVRSLVIVGLFAAWAGTAYAKDRDCTADERNKADDRLKAIAKNHMETDALIKLHLPFGKHNNTHAKEGGTTNEKLLLQGGYVLLHDGDLRTALWASHELTGAEVVAGQGKDRIECFRRDVRLVMKQAANPADYNEPIYDQGHMASDRDLRDSQIEQLNSYVMSNIAPQHCRFNRGIWLSLEHLGRIWAKKYKTVYVTSGPLFDFNLRDSRDKDKSAARVGSRSQKARVAVPSHYYKVFLRKRGKRWAIITFLLEHHNGPRGVGWKEIKPKLENAVMPLKEIEDRSEITFHPDLDRTLLDESQNGDGWDFTTGKANRESSCKYSRASSGGRDKRSSK